MSASVSTPKTCTVPLSPTDTAAVITALLAIAPENMTVAQLTQLYRIVRLRVSGGGSPTAIVGTLLA